MSGIGDGFIALLTLRGGTAGAMLCVQEIGAAVMMPPILIQTFPPDADGLLALCGDLVTDDMLVEISRADHHTDAEAHLDALRSIRDLACVPAPTQSVPMEVLNLARWTKTEGSGIPSGVVERRHVMRAFCCAALLRAAADEDGFGQGRCWLIGAEHDTLIQLIHSALFLGRDLPEAAARFLTWRLPRLPDSDESRAFFAFGLVSLTLLVRRDAIRAVDIEALASFVEDAENAFRDPLGVCTPDMFAGAFLDRPGHLQRHDAWRALAARVRAAVPDSERIATLARQIAFA